MPKPRKENWFIKKDGECFNIMENLSSGETMVAELWSTQKEETAHLIAAAPELLAELEKAHTIIRNALNIMTTRQQGKWEEMNYRDDVKDGLAVTRESARREVINKAKGI